MQNDSKGSLLLWVVVAIIGGLAMAAPFFTAYKLKPGEGREFLPPYTHDMAQHLAVMEQFDNVLKSGTLYPRWLPDFNRGYGSPWTNFYPVGFYYLTSGVNLLAKDWYLTLFIVSGLGLALSGITFYAAAQEFYGKWPSLIGALLYMITPYHLVDLYWRGAMPEFMAFIFIPPIFYFGSRLAGAARPKYIAGFALSYAALMIVHLPVSFLLAYGLVLYAILRAVFYKDPRILPRIAGGMILAFALSAIYLVPAVVESKDIFQPWSAIFPYSASYLNLFKPYDQFGAVVNLSFLACLLMLAASVLIVRAVPERGDDTRPDGGRDQFGRSVRLETLTTLIMAAVTLFMCLPVSAFVARLMPKMDVASFAWRWLAIASFFGCLGMAAAIARLVPELPSRRALIWGMTAVAAVVVAANAGFTGQSAMKKALVHPPLTVPDNYIDDGFTPKNSMLPERLPMHAQEAELVPASGSVQVDDWSPSHRHLTVSNSIPSDLRIRSYVFPGWTAEVDGAPTPILKNEMGAQTIQLMPGKHVVEVDFENTPIRSQATAISCLSLLVVAGLLLFSRFRRRGAGLAR